MPKKSFWYSISWPLLTYSHYLTLTVFLPLLEASQSRWNLPWQAEVLCTGFSGWKICCISWRRKRHPKSGSSTGLHEIRLGWMEPWAALVGVRGRGVGMEGSLRLPLTQDFPWFSDPKTSLSPWLWAIPALGCFTDVCPEGEDTWKLILTFIFPIILPVHCKCCD